MICDFRNADGTVRLIDVGPCPLPDLYKVPEMPAAPKYRKPFNPNIDYSHSYTCRVYDLRRRASDGAIIYVERAG